MQQYKLSTLTSAHLARLTMTENIEVPTPGLKNFGNSPIPDIRGGG